MTRFEYTCPGCGLRINTNDHYVTCPTCGRFFYAAQSAHQRPIEVITSVPFVDVTLIPGPKESEEGVPFSLLVFLHEQRDWSTRTFGPGRRTEGVTAHIEKELIEVRASPDDLSEWMDVVILALDGAWRTGATPEAIVAALQEKTARNRARAWPDWRTADEDGPIEHIRLPGHGCLGWEAKG